jgi:hypothetical protein
MVLCRNYPFELIVLVLEICRVATVKTEALSFICRYATGFEDEDENEDEDEICPIRFPVTFFAGCSSNVCHSSERA